MITWDFDVCKGDIVFNIYHSKRSPQPPKKDSLGAHSIASPGGNNVQLIDRLWQLGRDYSMVESPLICKEGESVQVGPAAGCSGAVLFGQQASPHAPGSWRCCLVTGVRDLGSWVSLGEKDSGLTGLRQNSAFAEVRESRQRATGRRGVPCARSSVPGDVCETHFACSSGKSGPAQMQRGEHCGAYVLVGGCVKCCALVSHVLASVLSACAQPGCPPLPLAFIAAWDLACFFLAFVLSQKLQAVGPCR